MLYQIADGTLTVGSRTVLSHVDFEIYGNEKIAVVGSNGAGKTTLLRLIAGELSLDRDDKREGPGISGARKATVGMLRQQAFADGERTVEEELLCACPCRDTYDRERYLYEKEYDVLFTGFGFAKEDKKKKLSEFSGGEQTKIALIGLLLQKPDILLLDEPTNHLDIPTVEWLEQYMKTYDRAVVMVSHDRFFLDETVQVVYELEEGRLTRYPGNYTNYRKQKEKNRERQQKAYERYMEEKERLEALIERFKHKPNKAAFARAKKKALERLPRAEKPRDEGSSLFAGEIVPLIPGSKRVLETERLQIGYDRVLLEVTMRIRKGQKIGILGDNGAGKTTFLKTIAGLMEPLGGKYALGNNTTIGYFDQHSAGIVSDKTVFRHFHDLFPSLTEKESRGILGAYLFGGKDACKQVSILSGGEKARLVLAELLQSRPNFLLLDEPTNHMDIRAKERLEEAFRAYKGTLLFVSHDRYFIQELADAVLIFQGRDVMYYPFGYRHYLEHCQKCRNGAGLSAIVRAEEQALLDGMRSVPRAERHRLREISTEEAYADWQMRLLGEQLSQARQSLELVLASKERQRNAWETSEAFWRAAVPGLPENAKGPLKGLEEKPEERPGMPEEHQEERETPGEEPGQLTRAWEAWHEACLEWYEGYLSCRAKEQTMD